MDQMILDLKSRTAAKNLIIVDHHFIQYDGKPPRTLKVTFENAEQASRDNPESIKTKLGMLLARSKKFDQHVSIRQCGVCRKTDHRRGDTNCDKKDRCPRCLSEDHITPEASCVPTCWTHKRGHSTGSDRCPLIIEYKRNKRRTANRDIIRENVVQRTPVESRDFHRDLLRVEDTIKSTSRSYANAAKNNTPSIPLANITKTPFDTSAYLQAYAGAAYNEAFNRGSFQESMDLYCDIKGWTKIKHPPPCIQVTICKLQEANRCPAGSRPEQFQERHP